MSEHLPIESIPSTPGAPTPGVTVEGTVDRIIYENADSAWCVVRVLEDPGGRPVTVVGNLLGVRVGEALRVAGTWVSDPRYGPQVRVERYLPLRPATLVGIERYLGSGLVPGVGPTTAGRLVAHFGLGTLEVIERDPQRLAEVGGIGPVRAARIQDAWRRQQGIQQVMLFLHEHGITPALASRIYRRYGDRAVACLRDDPYQLATEVHGVGFRTADAIARRVGIAPDAPRRIEAGVLHALGEAADAGHLFVTAEELKQYTVTLLGISEEAPVAAAIERLQGRGQVALEDWPDGCAVARSDLHLAEVAVARRLRRLAQSAPRALSIDVPRALAWVQERTRLDLAPQQIEALRRALEEALLVITGGPGTGKTTIVNGIVQILTRKGCRVLLGAPTGRAAKRLQETTGQPARTLHRLLEFSPRTGGFLRGPQQPLEADAVIVDETSMVDVLLFEQLLGALGEGCRLVLVGDADQLPSVGPGSVLRDLVASDRVPVVVLDEVFRQASASAIVTSAHRVRRGELPLGSQDPDSDYFFVEREEPERILETVQELIQTRIPRRFGVAPGDIQVLTPMQRGLLGAAHLNRVLQELVNPVGPALLRGERIFRRQDRVLQLRNDYDRDVFNGALGRITSVNEEAGTLAVRFDEGEFEYEREALDELGLAYACSIHKAQGSEFPVVVIPLHTQHYVMLRRNLLYTAMTRGRRLVVVVGSRRALALATRRQEGSERRSHLRERLAGSSPRPPERARAAPGAPPLPLPVPSKGGVPDGGVGRAGSGASRAD